MNVSPPTTRRPGLARRGVGWLSWLCLAVVLAVWGLLWTESEDWWPVTLAMFLPRWLWGVPLVLLAVAAVLVRRNVLWVPLVGIIVVLWPLMGFCIPWQILGSAEPAGFRCRILTCNVHRNRFGVTTAIAQARPDIVALQDFPGHFDPQTLGEGDWHVRSQGQFLLASRYPIREFKALEPPATSLKDMVVRAKLETPAGVVRFYNLHLATPRQALVSIRLHGWDAGPELQANSDTRREQSATIDAWMTEGDGPLLAAGDFNTPPDSTIYSEFWGKYTNAFSQAGMGWGFTYHMNRTALRIDHILASPGWRCRHCWVGPDVGSEHRPVIADMEWFGTP